MRNCFIPSCDAYCKDKMAKRMMFTAPKDEKLFNQWKEILINKRPLKPTDKVCERHFKPEEILTTWDHIINGEVCSVTRSKPCLKKDAIPSLNLVVKSPIKQKHTLKENNKRELPVNEEKPAKKKKKIEIVEDVTLNPADNPEVTENKTNNPEVTENETKSPEVTENETNNPEVTENETKSPEVVVVEEDDEELENSEQFDVLYDDVYEVTLPSTLWGIHRDPERKFLVFSEFHKEKMATSKIFFIDQKSNFKMLFNNERCSEGHFSDLSVERVEQKLHDFHEQLC